jgi:hypothetical protein
VVSTGVGEEWVEVSFEVRRRGNGCVGGGWVGGWVVGELLTLWFL